MSGLRVAFPRRPRRLATGSASLLLLAPTLGVAPAARAGEDLPRHDPKAAFTEADENGDGRIDRPEFVARLVEVFFHGDTDKDGFLSFAEMERVVAFPEDFRGADRSGDGRISMAEFLKVRAGTFDETDADSDGVLSPEEVIAVYERKGAGR
jgi:Ca2+-binding EF-hand superfamily protein